MEQITMMLWVFAGFVTAVTLRNLLLRMLQKSAISDDYYREMSDILTKEEYKVKGRFE